jgi:hypothetical protein
MAIENANYVAELNKLYPAETEAVADGDDHFRLLKKVLQQTFPGRAQPEGARIALSGASVAVDGTMLGAFVDALTATAVSLPKLGTDYAGYAFILRTQAAATISGTGGDTLNGGASQASSAAQLWFVMGTSSTTWALVAVNDPSVVNDANLATKLAGYLLKSGGTMTGLLTGRTSSLSMSQDAGATTGSFVTRSAGTGDANLSGMTFHNDAYGIKLGVRADGYFGLGGWSRVAWSWYSDASGNMVAAGNVSAYSDPRLKENFRRIKHPFSILEGLDGGTFTWKHGYKHTLVKAGKRDYGILADQVFEVMPEAVHDSIELGGETYQVVDYQKLIPVLIEAVKELKREIEELKK